MAIVRSVVLAVVVELRVTVLGLRLVVSPIGNDDEDSLIVPENPLNPVRATVAWPVSPAAILRNIGLTVRLKEGAMTWIVM